MKRTIYYCDFCGREIEDMNQAVKYEVSIGRLTNKQTIQIDAHDLCVESFLMRVRREDLIFAAERKDDEQIH